MTVGGRGGSLMFKNMVVQAGLTCVCLCVHVCMLEFVYINWNTDNRYGDFVSLILTQ